MSPVGAHLSHLLFVTFDSPKGTNVVPVEPCVNLRFAGFGEDYTHSEAEKSLHFKIKISNNINIIMMSRIKELWSGSGPIVNALKELRFYTNDTSFCS